MSSRLATTLCGISLKRRCWRPPEPTLTGSSFKNLTDLTVGGIVVKGLSREPMDGNPPPRLYETEAGMMNSIGLQNIGVRAFVADKLPALREIGRAIFANVFGYAVEDYVEVVRVLEDAEGRVGVRAERILPEHETRRDFLFKRPGVAGRSGGRGADRRPGGR